MSREDTRCWCGACADCLAEYPAPRREDAAGDGSNAELLLMFADVICPKLRDLLVPHGASATNWDDAAKQLRGIAAALSTAEREREELQRIVDLVNAEGSIVKPSTLNPGRVVVVDGRTGLDASEATALEAIAALFEEEDGGESPGRLYITHRVPSGGEEGR